VKTTHRKYVIIGAGPGGLQMGYFLAKSGLDYLILEKNTEAGSFFKKQPVHRKLISINKKNNFYKEDEFNWRHDWNSLLSDNPELRFTHYTDELFPNADVLFKYLGDYAKKCELNIDYGTEVLSIIKSSTDPNQKFSIILKNGDELTADVLFMATGAVGGNSPSEIEGIENTVSYSDQDLDLEIYKNKRVGILGGGNSAFETADYLAGSAAFVHVLTRGPIKMAWDTHFVGDVRAVNNNILDMYQLKSLHAVISPKIKKIEKLENGNLRTHHSYDYPKSSKPGSLELTRDYDFILNCTGFNWVSPELFDPSSRPNVTNLKKYPALTESWESENIKDLYFIGGAMQAIDRKSASGFIHGYRYNIRSLSKIIKAKYENIEIPFIDHNEFDLNKMLDEMYMRFSIGDGIFQQYGFLGDLLLFSKDTNSYKEYREMPVTFFKGLIAQDQHSFQLTLEFGFEKYKDSALTFMGPSDPNDTPCAAFLHPVIRHFYNGKTQEFHFGDSLLGRWDRPHGDGGAVMSYHYLFQKWLEKCLGRDFKLPEATSGGPYRLWTEKEIEDFNQMEMKKNKIIKTCQD
jgi:thioredoxin reductase